MIDRFFFMCRGSTNLLLFGVTAQIPKRAKAPPRDWPTQFGYGELAAQWVASASIVFILLLVIVKSYRRARKLYPVGHTGIVTNQVVSDVVGANRSMWRFVVWAGLWFIVAYPFLLSSNVDILGSVICFGTVFLLPVIGVTWFVIAGAYYTWKGRLTKQAVEMQKNGQGAAAITMVRTEIQKKGPSADRCSLLGVLLCTEGAWQEAADLFEQAEHLGGPNPVIDGNKAVTLWKLGRLPEALECYQDLESRVPSSLHYSNHGQILIEMGRIDEAVLILKRAESLVAKCGKADGKLRPDDLHNLALLRAKLYEKGVAIG